MAGKKVDINAANVDELATLTGVGRVKAEAIIESRRGADGFTAVEDLLSVPGIGASVLELNKSLLTCGIKSLTDEKRCSVGKRLSNRNGRLSESQGTSSSSNSSNSSRDENMGGTVEPSNGFIEIKIIGALPGSSQHLVSGSDNVEHCPVCGCNNMNRTQPNDCGINCGGNNWRSGHTCSSRRPPWDANSSGSDGDRIEEEEEEENEEQEQEMDDAEDLVDIDDGGAGGDSIVCIVDGNKDFDSVPCNGDRETCCSPTVEESDLKLLRDKQLMKRRSEEMVDGINLGKKACINEETENNSEVNENKTDTTQPTGESKISPSECQTPKKRLTAKISPVELSQWLSIFQRWSNIERMTALNQLIDACEPAQVRHMMNIIEPQFQRDFISLLPKELALYVLSFLEPRDLLRAAQTCRYWRVLAEDNLLWREKCREAGIDEVKDALGKRKTKVNVAPSPWKAAFMRQHNIEMNWRCRPIRPPQVLKGHDDHVITCLQFSGSRIVSGSDDNTLKVWSAITGKCLRTLLGHTGGVWSSQMSGNVIISGSTDRTLKVWNADTGQCIHTLYGHTSTVRCMHLHGNKVVSGSRDATLRVWDIDSGECLHVLVGHVAAVRCVQYDGRLVVSGAYDFMVKVWNPEREECLHTLQGHTNRVYSLQFDGIHVVSGSLDTSIRVWDVETGACKHTLMGHQSLTSGMELKNNILVSGNADSTVKVWDITTGQCLQTLSGPNKHLSAVTCLQFNSKFVITSSDDGTVKLWDLKTGDFIKNLVALDSGGSGGVVWRIRASPTKLVCAVGSRNGTEETKLLVLDFDADVK